MVFRNILIAAALSLVSASQAAAFDTPPPIDAPELDTSDLSSASGWYFRGDLGYNFSLKSDSPTYSANSGTGSFTPTTFDKHRFEKDLGFAAGAGYQFNDFLRSDTTLDYFATDHKGSTAWEPCAVSDSGSIGGCSYRKQDFTTLGLLANGYVDLGTYFGMTPYVGAGAGVSYVKYGNVGDSRICDDCTSSDYSVSKKQGADSWRFTYALMAGMSYDLSAGMKLDLGYRYSRIGSGDMYEYSTLDQATGGFGAKAKDHGLSRHEFRAGLRMLSW